MIIFYQREGYFNHKQWKMTPNEGCLKDQTQPVHDKNWGL